MLLSVSISSQLTSDSRPYTSHPPAALGLFPEPGPGVGLDSLPSGSAEGGFPQPPSRGARPAFALGGVVILSKPSGWLSPPAAPCLPPGPRAWAPSTPAGQWAPLQLCPQLLSRPAPGSDAERPGRSLLPSSVTPCLTLPYGGRASLGQVLEPHLPAPPPGDATALQGAEHSPDPST